VRRAEQEENKQKKKFCVSASFFLSKG